MKKIKFNIITWGSLILAASSLISRLLGVARDAIFAHVFGTSAALDAYFVAFRIPDLIYTLLVFGAMSAAFVPLYTKLKKGSQAKASEFASVVLNGLLILLLISTAIFFVAAPLFIPWIAPGFDAEAQATTVQLSRIMLLSPLFLGMSSLFQGIENAHKKFLGIALAPIVYNLSIILSATFFGTSHGVFALAWGVAVGALLHMLVQIPGALRAGFSYQLRFNPKDKNLKEFLLLSLPRLFGMGVTQMGIFIDTILASFLATGSLSIFNYALNLQGLPYGIVAVSVSIAAFATLSEEGDEEDKSAFLSTVKKALEQITFWIVPAVTGLFILREEIVKLLLQRGAFGEEALAATVLTLGIFVWAGIGSSFIPLLARAFYALHDTKTPVGIAFICVCLAAGMSFTLTQKMGWGVEALALSAVVSSALNASLLNISLKRKLQVKFSSFLPWESIAKCIFCSAVMAAAVILLKGQLNLPLLWQSAALIGAGGLSYLGLSRIMKTSPWSHAGKND